MWCQDSCGSNSIQQKIRYHFILSIGLPRILCLSQTTPINLESKTLSFKKYSTNSDLQTAEFSDIQSSDTWHTWIVIFWRFDHSRNIKLAHQQKLESRIRRLTPVRSFYPSNLIYRRVIVWLRRSSAQIYDAHRSPSPIFTSLNCSSLTNRQLGVGSSFWVNRCWFHPSFHFRHLSLFLFKNLCYLYFYEKRNLEG